MFSCVWVIERCFEWKLLVFHWLDVTRYGLIPVDYPFFFVSEPINLLNVSMPDKSFVVASYCGFGSRDIVCVKRSHQ